MLGPGASDNPLSWVSGPGQPLMVPIMALGVTLSLEIQHPIVTMQLDAAHQKATGGILAGVLPTSSGVVRAPRARYFTMTETGPTTALVSVARTWAAVTQ